MNLSQLNFGLFSVKLFGLCLGIAFLVASWYWYKRIQRENLPHDFFVHHFWRWLLGGVLLGRLGSLLAHPEVFDIYGIFAFFAFWHGELHFIGFVLGFVLVLWTDLRQHNQKPLRWLDLAVFPFLLAVMMSDVFAFLTGAVYGSETALWWGVQYEATGVKILSPVHPVTLYALFGNIALWFTAKHYWPKWKNTPGKLAAFMAFWFFLLQVIWQLFRGDDTLIVFGLIRLEQLLSLLIVAFLFWWYRRQYAK